MLEQEEIISILNEALNQKARIRKGSDAVYFCPKCNHHKRKLEINLNTGKYNCWVCNFSGLNFKTFFKKINVKIPKSFFEAVRLNNKSKTDIKNIFTEEISSECILSLPKEYHPLYKVRDSIEYRNAFKYLMKRGITKFDILRHQIGYCEEGEYKQRIIIPSFDSDCKLNFFVGRSYYNECNLKYNNCLFSKNVIGFESTLNFDEEITLVEGVFDAIVVRKNVVPLFGKTMSKKLKLSLILNKVPSVNVMLDDDAKKESLKICDFLIKHNIKTRMISLDGKDPSEVGFEKTWNTINNTEFLDFEKMFNLKIDL